MKTLELLKATLVKWASINSGSYNKAGIEKMRSVLAEDFAIFKGAECRMLEFPGLTGTETVPALSIIMRPQAPKQIFLAGHMDTVFGLESPFQACTQINEDRLRGPGVVDMKGGLLVMREALSLFEGSALAKNFGWEVLITSDEEIGSPFSKDYLLRAAKRFDYGLIFEPALPDGNLVRQRFGSLLLELKAVGKAAHVGRNFKEGKSALAAIVGVLNAFLEAVAKKYPSAIVNLGFLEGGGPVNIVPSSAVAKLNVRTQESAQQTAILELWKEFLSDYAVRFGVQFESTMPLCRPAKVLNKGLEDLFKKAQRAAGKMGLELDWKDTGGVCDGNILASGGLPVLDSLGAIGGGMHTEQEFVYLPSLPERIELTYRLLEEIARK